MAIRADHGSGAAVMGFSSVPHCLSQWQTAVHEAGHAVAAMTFGFEVRWMCCDVRRETEKGTLLGFVQNAPMVADVGADRTCYGCSRAIVRLAGDVAESHYTGRKVKGHESWEVKQLFSSAPGLNRAQRASSPRVLRAATEALIELRWPSVLALAHELHRRGRMTGGLARTYLADRGVEARELGYWFAKSLVERAAQKLVQPVHQLSLPGVR